MQVLSFPVFQGDDSSGFPLRKTEKWTSYHSGDWDFCFDLNESVRDLPEIIISVFGAGDDAKDKPPVEVKKQSKKNLKFSGS